MLHNVLGTRGRHLNFFICLDFDATSMDIFKAMLNAEIIGALASVGFL